MLSSPSPLFLSLHCLSHFFIAHGLREQLAFWMLFPPLWAHIDWLPPPNKKKQSSMRCRQPAFCWCCSKKKSEGGKKKKRGAGKSSGGFSITCWGISVLPLPASPAVMRINGVYHISLMCFCQVESNSRLLCLQSPVLLLLLLLFLLFILFIAPAGSLHPFAVVFVDRTPLLSLQRWRRVAPKVP